MFCSLACQHVDVLQHAGSCWTFLWFYYFYDLCMFSSSARQHVSMFSVFSTSVFPAVLIILKFSYFCRSVGRHVSTFNLLANIAFLVLFAFSRFLHFAKLSTPACEPDQRVLNFCIFCISALFVIFEIIADRYFSMCARSALLQFMYFSQFCTSWDLCIF